jgi:hypothetical protein
MTTYTTPHFANGLPDRNVRPASDKESINRARPVDTAGYRTAGVSNAGPASLADARTPDWQPGASNGVPKAAIGALGAALVGGAALAFVLLSPSNVTKTVNPDRVAASTAQKTGTDPRDSSGDAVNSINAQAPAAGTTAPANAATSTEWRAQAAGNDAQATATTAAAVPPAAVAATPPAVVAPVARNVHRVNASPAAPSVTTTSTPAPAVAPDEAVMAPAPTTSPATSPADTSAPAMQQTPDSSTVAPSTHAPTSTAPESPTPVPTTNP